MFTGNEEGSLDGPLTTCFFKQPMGMATEFDSVTVRVRCTNKEHQTAEQNEPLHKIP